MQNQYSRQQGGTVLGIIVGLVIGLGIALAVALAITKTPVPFINKMNKPEKTAANGAGQNADPNKPLYGNKTPVKEAAKEFAKETAKETVSSDPIAEIANKKMDSKAGTKVAAVDPSLASKKAEPKAAEIKLPNAGNDAAAKSDSAEEKWSYYLQAGAFREQTDAENTRAKLALMGVEARVSERQSENGTLYRVRVGPFTQLESMNRVRGKLTDNGVDVAVVRISK